VSLLADEDVEEVNESLDRAFAVTQPEAGVVLAMGEGAKVLVRLGHLVVEDGLGERRQRRFSRGQPELRRLVVDARSGYLTLEALEWAHQVGTEVVVLGTDDGVLLSSVEGKVDGRLHRAQAAAGMGDDPMGLAVVAELLHRKLSGQASLLRSKLAPAGSGVMPPEDAATEVEGWAAKLATAPTIDALRQAEAGAAAAYFEAWAAHPSTSPRFRPADERKVPQHWLAYEARRSAVTPNSNRKATHPANAVLNYLSALAKAAAVRACRTVGLDPDMGLLHLDMARRPGMALDVIEPVRPRIEAFALDLLAGRTFRRHDFLEQPDGSVRLSLELRQSLAATMARWESEVAPVAELVTRMLSESVATKFDATTPLSRARSKEAAAEVKARRQGTSLRAKQPKSATFSSLAKRSSGRTTPAGSPQLFRTCEGCGGQLDGAMSSRPLRQRYCSTCLDHEVPGQAEHHRRRRGRGIAASRAELERWRAEHPGAKVRPADFEPVRAGLAKVKLSEIMAATGVAKSTASMIRSGRHVPALRHWEALAELAGLPFPTGPLYPVEPEVVMAEEAR
jgi:CRISPR-associated endonuclease Cas1